MTKFEPGCNIVLDTSVILHDVNYVYRFGSCRILVPFCVIDEIDKFKTYEDQRGRNAREFSRQVNELRKKGSLSEGVALPTAGYLQILPALNSPHNSKPTDDQLVYICLENRAKLATHDINLSIKASVYNVDIIDLSIDDVIENVSDLYTGIVDISISSEEIDKLHKEGKLLWDEEDLYPNQGVSLQSLTDSNHSTLAIHRDGYLHTLRWANKKMLSRIFARSREQTIAVELLMDPEIKLVTLSGLAGSGKSLLAVACGLQQTIEGNAYNQMRVSRPIQPMGKDLGYLPGGIEDKLDPWMAPIKDAVEFLFKNSNQYYSLQDIGKLVIEPLMYIRGRSIPNTFFILDEGQQTSRHELKTLISRMGQGSKIVLTGDIFQIDSEYLDSINNGLTHVIEKFKGERIAGHVSLVKGERSELATLASRLL